MLPVAIEKYNKEVSKLTAKITMENKPQEESKDQKKKCFLHNWFKNISIMSVWIKMKEQKKRFMSHLNRIKILKDENVQFKFRMKIKT